MTTPWLRRGLLGVAIAATLSASLWLAIQRVERRDARAAERGAAHTGVGATHAHGLEVGDAVGATIDVPIGLPRGEASTFTFARRLEDLPDLVAPVAGIRRGGGIWVLRGAPAPTRPAGTSGGWSAGVVLPRGSLAELLPAERAALLELLRAWSGGVALDPATMRSAGMRIEVRDLETILRWRR